jgi:hypothetical protein
MKVQSCSNLALALLSLSLALQAVPATHEFDGQRQDCAAGSWGTSLLDSRASAVATVRLPCCANPCYHAARSTSLVAVSADEEVGAMLCVQGCFHTVRPTTTAAP